MRAKSEKFSANMQNRSPYNKRRPSALSSEKITYSLFNIGGALDSQTTDSQYFDIPDTGYQASLSPVKAEFHEEEGNGFGAVVDEIPIIDLCSSSPLARQYSKSPADIYSRLLEAREIVAALERELFSALGKDLMQNTLQTRKAANLTAKQMGTPLSALMKLEPLTPSPKNKSIKFKTLEVIPETPQSSPELHLPSFSPAHPLSIVTPNEDDGWHSDDLNPENPYRPSIESQLYKTITAGRYE